MELLLDLEEGRGLGATLVGGLPVVRLASVGHEPDGAVLGVSGLHPVADVGTGTALSGLAERDNIAGLRHG